MSGKIEKIVIEAIDLAKSLNHEYVTIEHLAVITLDDVAVRAMCYEVKADALGIQEAITSYLENDCDDMVVDDEIELTPRKTQMLERVFNRALTQALFQGKQAINQLDLLQSILSEEQSAATLFSLEFGLSKYTIGDWLHEVQALSEHNEEKDKSEEAYWREMGMDSAYQDYYKNSGDQNQYYTPEQLEQLKKAAQKQSKVSNQTKRSRQAIEVLAQFTVDMNVASQDYDDVVGRREELRDLVQTLARKKKSNAILVGNSGVGKTAIVEGLAKLIVEGNVPDTMKNKVVLALDMAKLVAGTKYRGDFEERMKLVIEALNITKDVVLFIDEIHMVVGAGNTGSSGAMDAGNMLKPALTNGNLKVIGATTDEEYRKLFEKEAALARRFTKIMIEEPTVEEAKTILRNSIVSYEMHYGFEIEEQACDIAVELSDQYIFNKKLPDKAFDIIDRTCAYNKILPQDEQKEIITVEMIRDEIARYTGIPSEHLGTEMEANTVKKSQDVEQYLRNTVYGQDEAIQKVSDSITVSMAGLKDPQKPIASYLFTGPTGVGKTELAKRLSQGMSMKLVRYDMAEYQESHTVSKFIGSPPGYVGHGDGKAGDGLLISDLEDHPNCVLLLDEVEKAHPDIMSVLLSLMDDGVITSSTGKKVSGKNIIIIMTSNLGARQSQAIGFGEEKFNTSAVTEAVKNFFAPEFRNRLDGIITFNSLIPENIERIVVKFLHEIDLTVASRHMNITWLAAIKNYLAKEGFHPTMGARPLARLINEKVKLPLAKFIMDNNTPAGVKLTVGYDHGKDETVINIKPPRKPRLTAPTKTTEPEPKDETPDK
jgi:ATP-dependent Clp protease ATP-binding subunit ClpA|tara:strand:+ start:9343 stop:11814 length:2472 start_codon:yes stop_codon:yes gene_type:complete